jgi:hypothetical protein
MFAQGVRVAEREPGTLTRTLSAGVKAAPGIAACRLALRELLRTIDVLCWNVVALARHAERNGEIEAPRRAGEEWQRFSVTVDMVVRALAPR